MEAPLRHINCRNLTLEVVDGTTIKMARKPVKIQRKVQQDALGKVNRVKEIRRRRKDGLEINRQQLFVRKKVSRAVGER